MKLGSSQDNGCMPRPKTEAADYERLTLRLPKDVMEALRQAAAAAHRPLNTHTILLLRHMLGLQPQPAAERQRRERPGGE
jgi:predicted HicB family RNase H-like nuclease